MKANFTLIYQGTRYHVHKDVLSLHCKTFAALFEEKTLHDTEISVPEIKFCDQDAFNAFIQQLYSVFSHSFITLKNLLGVVAIVHWTDSPTIRKKCLDFIFKHFFALPFKTLCQIYETYLYSELEPMIIEMLYQDGFYNRHHFNEKIHCINTELRIKLLEYTFTKLRTYSTNSIVEF